MPSITENGDGRAAYRLAQEIIALSVADTWAEAKAEWEMVEVQLADPDAPHTCLCGHFPIIQLCVLSNRETGATAIVGNTCVTKFMGIPAGLIFTGLERIKDDPDAALNAAAVEYAHGKGWINNWQRGFALDTCRRKRLSWKMRAKRREINERVLASMTAASREASYANS